MPINPHLSDQLAADMRNLHHGFDCIITETVPQLIERLLQQLPGVSEQLLGEVLLHTADVGAAMATAMARRGHRAQDIAPSVALALGEAGARLYSDEAGRR
jgi:hypothetical protein